MSQTSSIFVHSLYLDDNYFIGQTQFLYDKFTILNLNCQSLNLKIHFGIHFSVKTWLNESSDTYLLVLDLTFSEQKLYCTRWASNIH